MALKPGGLVELGGGDFTPGDGETHLCLSARYTFVSQAYGSVAACGIDSDKPFTADYVLTPSSAPMTPERKTRRPVIHGPQTAVVVGEGEIDCDEYGRILVRFHWDLAGANSMRCRVSQSWASKGWGGMVIPRIGMEVVVEHLEGDPDKPLVTGCVYNGKNDVPYQLPANKTVSTFLSKTHTGTGFNELRIEDEKGREEIFVHAQKDRNEKTLNNHTERVDNNWVQSIGHNKAIEVTNNHTEQIGGNLSISVGPGGIGQLVSNVFTGLTDGIGNLGYNLGLPGILNPGEGNMSLAVEKAKSESIGTISTTQVGISSYLTAGVSVEVTAGKAMGVTVGERSSESVGKTKTVDVGELFTLMCGKSRLVMKADGTIVLSGKDIRFEADNGIKAVAKTIDMN